MPHIIMINTVISNELTKQYVSAVSLLILHNSVQVSTRDFIPGISTNIAALTGTFKRSNFSSNLKYCNTASQ